MVEYAGKIQRSEGGDPAIVTLAACLSGMWDGASAGLNANARQLSAEDIADGPIHSLAEPGLPKS